MFRIDDELVIDATMAGGCARLVLKDSIFNTLKLK